MKIPQSKSKCFYFQTVYFNSFQIELGNEYRVRTEVLKLRLEFQTFDLDPNDAFSSTYSAPTPSELAAIG